MQQAGIAADRVATPSQDSLSEAARTAQRLTQMLDALIARAEQEGEALGRMTDRVRELEARDATAGHWRNRVERALDTELSAEEIRGMLDTLDSLAHRPADLLILVKISEMASRLAAIVRAYAEMRDIIVTGNEGR